MGWDDCSGMTGVAGMEALDDGRDLGPWARTAGRREAAPLEQAVTAAPFRV